MKLRWVIAAVAVFILITAALSLRTERDVTTTSNEAYTFFMAGKEAADRLYNNEALEHFEEAVRADSSFAFAWALLSKFYYHLGRSEEGKMAAKTAYKLAQDLPDKERLSITLQTAELRGNMTEFEATLELMLERYPKEEEPHYFLANQLWHQLKLEEAIEEFKIVLKINPNHALSFNCLGYLHAQLGRYGEAIEYLKKYIFIAPDQANPHDSLGEIYIMMGRYDEAIEQFNRAIAVKPTFAYEPGNLASMIHQHIAKALVEKGKIDEARRMLQKALDLSPSDYFEQQVKIQEAKIYSIQKQYPEAITALNEAIDIYGQDESFAPSLAAMYCEMGKSSEIGELIVDYGKYLTRVLHKSFGDTVDSIDQLTEEQIKSNRSVDLTVRQERLLHIYYNKSVGNFETALEDIEHLLDEVTYSESKMMLQYLKAKINFDLGHYADALEAVRYILDINPNDSHTELLKANTEFRAGNPEEALNTLKRFIAKTYDADPDWVLRREAIELMEEIETPPLSLNN
jgi:superkiller protein 3